MRGSMCCCHTGILSYVNDDGSFDIDKDREEARRNRGQYNVGRGKGRMRNENDLRCYVFGSDRHLKCDGQVERFNETLLNMLSKHVKEDQENWDDELPFLMMAYRCSVNETTGFTPSMLMLGHELRLPIDIVFGECP